MRNNVSSNKVPRQYSSKTNSLGLNSSNNTPDHTLPVAFVTNQIKIDLLDKSPHPTSIKRNASKL